MMAAKRREDRFAIKRRRGIGQAARQFPPQRFATFGRILGRLAPGSRIDDVIHQSMMGSDARFVNLHPNPRFPDADRPLTGEAKGQEGGAGGAGASPPPTSPDKPQRTSGL